MPLEQTLRELLAVLYAAPLRPEFWATFLSNLSDVTGYQKGTIIAHNALVNSHEVLAASGELAEDAKSIAAYEGHYYQFDLWTQTLWKRRTGKRIIQGQEIWSKDEFRKSVFFNEFLTQVGIGDGVFVATPGGSSYFESLSLYKGDFDGPFSNEHVALLTLLEPHLQTAFATRRRLIELESRVDDLENSLNKLNSALILLDSRRRPVFVNSSAHRILRQQDGLRLRSSELTAGCASENNRLQEMMGKAASTRSDGYSGGRSMLVSRSRGGPLCVFATPLAESGAPFRNAVAILFVTDPDKKQAIPSEVLRDLYGLTKAESRIALLLFEGNTLSEAAERVGVSRETVRSQIRGALQKMGMKRQSQLIGLLTALCPARFPSDSDDLIRPQHIPDH